MSYTLGLDIGSKSIGWALLSDKPKSSIIDIGVRVFPEGVDRDTRGAEKSKSAQRREARGARRTHKRRNLRRDKLIKTLRENSLLPLSDKDLRDLLSTKDPYQIRARGLDEKLEPHEFGRALFHINQRRGFKSNRKTGQAKEDGKVAKEAGELQQKIKEAECRTLGEYFSCLDPEEVRIRDQYTFRSMYEHEFDLLWKKQAEFYPNILTEDLYKKIHNEVIFYQRPLKPTDDLIGLCDLEPDEKRCPRGDWYARRFRILQDLNNLKIHNPDGSESELNPEQREILLKELRQKKEVKFDRIRKILGLIEIQGFNAEYEINEKGKKMDKLKGDIFNWSMRNKNVFGTKRWDSMDEKEKIELNNACLELDDDQLLERMIEEYGFTKEQADGVLKISLPQRYMSFSRKAIIKLLPFMEAGALTSEAIEKAGYKKSEQKKQNLDNIPSPEDLRNPIVNKALQEVRKVVNAIIREYGKPSKIVLEMARDVKGNTRERRELQFKMRENEKRNDEAKKRLKEDIGIRNPSRNDIIKYNLWEECGHTCVYTGKHISQSALFSDNPEFQIEHILPYDRSLDDSYMNKTLCDVHENIHIKGEKTPYEAYNHDEEKYEQIKQRTKALPWPKRSKFLQKGLNIDGCIERELNDTRYICKEVVGYIQKLGVSVRGTKGKTTAELRHQWGLNSILDLSSSDIKNRDDYRHHSIDAVVVAVTKNEHLRKLAKSKYSKVDSSFPQPWTNFREELQEKVKHIDVSHRPTHKVSGPLHEETSYGPTDKEDTFVYRKKLEDLTGPMVSKIVDPVVRQIVQDRLVKNEINIDTDKKIPKEVWNEPLYMRTTKSDKKIQIKKVRIRDIFNKMILLKDKSGKPYRAVAPGRNHHIEIIEYTDEKGNIKKDGKVVTMFEAVRRRRKVEPVIKRDHGPNKKFVCSLTINDMVMLPNKKGEKDLYRVQKMSINKQIYFRHHTAATIDNDSTLIRKQANLFDGYKVTVDPLGRIHPAND